MKLDSAVDSSVSAPRRCADNRDVKASQLRKRLYQGVVALAAAAGASVGYGATTIGAGGSAGLGAGVAALATWTALVKSKDALMGLRSDGTLVKNATVMRRFMPFLMPTRESARIDYQHRLRLDRALIFVDAWNRTHPQALHITTFHIILAAIQRANLLHPGLNRFIKGKRLFQRHVFSLAFVVKAAKKSYASLRTVKLTSIAGEDFAGYVQRINQSIHTERVTRPANAAESEMKLAERMPRALLSLALWARDRLDDEGLWPQSWMEHDPLYASVFVANLGSLDKSDMPNVKHHLYECGTVSLFGTLCSIDASGRHPTMLVNWTYDERVNDAHYCLAPLKAMRQAVEDPSCLLDPIDAAQIMAGLHHDKLSADRALAWEDAATGQATYL